jgi:hypothetical protein
MSIRTILEREAIIIALRPSSVLLLDDKKYKMAEKRPAIITKIP